MTLKPDVPVARMLKTLPKWLAHLLNVLVTEKVKRAQENVAASIIRTKIILPLRERGN